MFGFIGKLVTLPVRIVNAPIQAAENIMAGGEPHDADRILSKPLDAVADAIEEATEDMDE